MKSTASRIEDWLFTAPIHHVVLGLAAVIIMLAAIVVASIETYDHYRGVVAGTVIAKDHQGMWTQFITVPAGKTTTITPIVHPEEWRIYVDGVDRFGRETRQWRDINEADWLSIAVGDEWEAR